ncbi:MAG: DUF1329 domain-containing protein, partial [Candidatus Binatia bacterium]
STLSSRDLLLVALLAFLVPVRPSLADVSPGEVITPENADKVKDLVSPGLEWCIRYGWPMRIVETKKIEWPKAYREATEKYSPQVKLAGDGLTLENYVAGQPFPTLDPNDPQIAIKIMWNYEYKYTITDDVDLRNFDADTGSIQQKAPMSVERHFLLDHFRVLSYAGRLYNEPKGIWETGEGYQKKQSPTPCSSPST